MFGSSNPFGQASSSSPFGTQTQSVFGQSNNTSNNPFAPKPFGTSTPFGAQTGSSMFGGTSTGVFGAPQTSSPFGASSQAFGTSTPAFGASSAPAFGSSTSPFGGSSTFGQKSFGLSTPQSSPFGSTTQQSQPAFGNNTFGTSNTPAFGASSTPAFGATNTPAFSATNTPAFSATGTPGFGATSTPGFGVTSTPGFGASSTSAFGSTNTPAFGALSTPSFGASISPAFGASPTPAFGSSGTAFGNNAFGSGGAFGASSTSAFGASSTPAFGASSTPAFGASSSPSFNFGSSPAFGQSTSAFCSSSFGSTQSSFGAQGSNPMFGGQSTIGGQQGGSRVMPYAPTNETESANGGQPTGKLQSISAMPVHKEKSQEELRWEDYQRGDKGGQLPAGTGFGVTNSQPSLFSVSPAFGQTSTNQANPFSSSIATNTFAPTITPKISSPFGQTPTPSNPLSNPFGQTPSIFGSTSSNTTSVFGSSSGLATNTSQPFGSAPAQGQGSTPAYSIGGNFNNSQSSPLFSSNLSLGQNGSAFGQNTNPGYAQTNTFSTPSTGFTNMFSISPSLTTISPSFGQASATFFSTNLHPVSLPSYQSVQPAQPPGAFGLNNFGQTPIANATGFSLGLGALSQGGNFGQVSAPTSSAVMPIPVQLLKVEIHLRFSTESPACLRQKKKKNRAAFGASSSPLFNFGNSPAFGQSTSAFGSSSFGSTQSSFGAQGSNPMFGGQSTIRGQQGGSRVMPYAPTTETESANGGQPTGKLQSISAMPVHKEKSQEELRWEDYQRGDKGGQLPAGQSPGGTGFGVTNSQPSLFSVSPAFGQKSTNQANPFSSSIATNTFAPTITPKISSPFGQTPSIFGSTSSNTTSVFGSSSGLATNTSQPFGSSVFSSAPAQGQGSTPAFCIGQTPIVNATGFSLGLGALSQGGNFGSAPTSSAVMPIPVTNPFGTLPALSQISIAQGGNSPSIQYGISSLPVVDKPAPVRVSPLLTSRHLLQRRVRLPTRKYRPGDDIPKL